MLGVCASEATAEFSLEPSRGCEEIWLAGEEHVSETGRESSLVS